MAVEVVLRLSPTALEIIKRSLFAYEAMLELGVHSVLRDKIKGRYGTALEDDLPKPFCQAVKKVRISLY